MSELGQPPRDELHLPELHLPDLSIVGFRGIDALTIPRLGRVTLLAGRNGVGKTTILEAIRVYAARGRYAVLSELAAGHEELSPFVDEDGDRVWMPDMTALFHGRAISSNASIEIGSASEEATNRLRIEIAHPTKEQLSMLEEFFPENVDDTELRVLRTSFQKGESIIPWPLALDEQNAFNPNRFLSYRGLRRLRSHDEPAMAMGCVSLGPGLIQDDEVAVFWDNVALTDDEYYAIESLQLVLGNKVERVALIGDDEPRYRGRGRRVIVKIADHDRPVPLKSLGDGATRLFGFALALANSRNGFLLIDEAENGIHYSVHPEFWQVVLRTAHKNNVQVLATTHGWDCISGFARAAIENKDVEGVLIRLEKYDEQVKAIEYSESELEIAATQGIEVR